MCYQFTFIVPNKVSFYICYRLGDSSIGSSQSFRQISTISTNSTEADFLHYTESKTLDDLQVYEKVYSAIGIPLLYLELQHLCIIFLG